MPSTLTCRFLLEARRARAGLAGVRQAVTPAWKHPTVCRQSLTSLLPLPPPRERYHQCLPRQFSSESSCVGLLLASHCLVVRMGGKNNSPTVIEALWWTKAPGLDEFQSLVVPLCSPSPSLPLLFRGAAHLGVTNYRVGAVLISSVLWCFLTISCVAVSGKIQVNNTRVNFRCWVVWLWMRLWFLVPFLDKVF